MEFILSLLFKVFVVVAVVFTIVGTVGTIFDFKKLENENEDLKDKLKASRKRKMGGKK